MSLDIVDDQIEEVGMVLVSNALIWNKLRELQLKTRFSSLFKVESESGAKDIDPQASNASVVFLFLSESTCQARNFSSPHTTIKF